MAFKVFNLRCAADHRFEGWFASQDDHEQQAARGLLECPLCGSKDVQRAPTAPYVNLAAAPPRPRAQSPREPQVQAAASPEQVQAMLVKLARDVVAACEDVGEQFAEEARRIHYAEAPERSIRGVATPDEAAALHDEGIAVMPLPFGALFKEPLQ
jgi:hypothetical protein